MLADVCADGCLLVPCCCPASLLPMLPPLLPSLLLLLGLLPLLGAPAGRWREDGPLGPAGAVLVCFHCCPGWCLQRSPGSGAGALPSALSCPGPASGWINGSRFCAACSPPRFFHLPLPCSPCPFSRFLSSLFHLSAVSTHSPGSSVPRPAPLAHFPNPGSVPFSIFPFSISEKACLAPCLAPRPTLADLPTACSPAACTGNPRIIFLRCSPAAREASTPTPFWIPNHALALCIFLRFFRRFAPFFYSAVWHCALWRLDQRLLLYSFAGSNLSQPQSPATTSLVPFVA